MQAAVIIGRQISHENIIRLSYRIRGYADRIINNINIAGTLHQYLPVNKILSQRLIKIIIAYSARKKSVKPAPPYSMLNPETSSLSPSDKSNGARLVSAKIIIRKSSTLINKNLIIYTLVGDNARLPRRAKGGKILRNRITSYLTDCLRDR